MSVQAEAPIQNQDYDWQALETAFENHEPHGWFTSLNYHCYFTVVDAVAMIEEHYHEIVDIREQRLEGFLWGQMRTFQRQGILKELKTNIVAMGDKVRIALRILGNFTLNAYNSIKTYSGKAKSISLNKLNATLSQHPENRQEFTKTRLEYIQWVLSDTYSTQIVEEYIDPYLDGTAINFNDMTEWLAQYEQQVEIFLQWIHGFLTDVLEELSTGIAEFDAQVRDRLLTHRYNDDRPDWSMVKSLASDLMDEPDIQEFIEVLRNVHDYGGSGRNYIGLRIWVDNLDEIEEWENAQDDDYDGYDPSMEPRPEPELQVEMITELNRRDELVKDWDEIHEWADELQLDHSPEVDIDQESDPNTANGSGVNEAEIALRTFKTFNDVGALDVPEGTFDEVFTYIYENPSGVDPVADELMMPVQAAESVLEKLVDEGVFIYDDGNGVYMIP